MTKTDTCIWVEASLDILRDVSDLSDSLTAEQAVEYRIAVEHVIAAAKETVSLLNMQIVKVLETDVIRDGRRFYVGRKKDHERFDHDAICGRVIAEAADHAMAEAAEYDNYQDEDWAGVVAARWATHMMRDIYLSDSTKAKVQQLDRYGIPRDKDDPASVRTWTPGEKIVVDIPAGGQE